jgi:hypothetical protein
MANFNSDLSKVIGRTMYSKRERHQTLGGNTLSTIFDTNWSTVQNSAIFNNYGSGVEVGNFQIVFNDTSNTGKQYNNGDWIRNKSGDGGTYNISVNTYGHIISAIPNNNGIDYKIGDRFNVISGGGINGLVEISSIGENGSVTGLIIITPGVGYQSSSDIQLNDDFWSFDELVNDRVSQDTLAKNDDWKLKLDWRNLNSFALYGSLNELIRASFEDIVLKFPASLWMIPKNILTGLNYELQNPFNIDIFTDNTDSDDIRIFIPNYDKYEIIQTHWVECSNLCDNPTIYSQNVLSDCVTDISKVTPSYRYVYVKKPKYYDNPYNPNDPFINGFIGFINDPIYDDPLGGFTVKNNDIIVTSTENDLLNSLNAYYYPVKLLDSLEIETKLRNDSPDIARAYPCAICNCDPFEYGPGTGATATVTVANGEIQTIRVLNPGSNYDQNSTRVIIIDPTGNGATAVSDIDTNGSILSIRLITAGSGYTNPIVKIIDDINHREAFAYSIVDNGVISRIVLADGGSGFIRPSILIIDITGNGATTETVLDNNGTITNIFVRNGGSNYTEPEISIIETDLRNRATAIATANSGIASITLTNGGFGYINPVITLEKCNNINCYINVCVEEKILLSNIKIGDNLGGKILYFDTSKSLNYEMFEYTISSSNGASLRFVFHVGGGSMISLVSPELIDPNTGEGGFIRIYERVYGWQVSEVLFPNDFIINDIFNRWGNTPNPSGWTFDDAWYFKDICTNNTINDDHICLEIGQNKSCTYCDTVDDPSCVLGNGAIIRYELTDSIITNLTLTNGGSGYKGNCICVKITDNIVCSSHIFKIKYIYNDINGEPCDFIKTEVEIDDGTIFSDGSLTNPSISFHIRPKKEYIEYFFNNLNDFQRTLLNRYTIPIYTSKFNVPIPNEMGDYVGMWGEINYTWTNPDGWNLDINTNVYNDFINQLSNVSEYLDTNGGRCDNLYRMLVHESLKNLDWSFQRFEDDKLAEAHILGETKFKKMMRVYGRQYDEIKKYIHGIEIMNNLTYDESDNYPDAMLKINVEYFGWKSLSLENKKNIGYTTGQLYHGWSKDYNSHDLELEFYRRLLINSAHLAKWKGTKHGLEMMMNLFGIERNNWEILEYVYVATGTNFMSTDKNYMFTNYKPTTNVQDGYFYRVESGAVTYNGVTYYPGQGFYACPGGGIPTGGTFYMDEVENIAFLNEKSSSTLLGDVFYRTKLTQEDEPEYRNPDDLHDLCIERWFYGDWKVCPICGPYNPSTGIGGGVISSSGTGVSICERCNGTGQVRDFVGVPAFKGNTDILYYQQKGGWYQDTISTIGLANSLNDLFIINQSDLQEGMVYYVKYDEIIGSTNYWVLIDLNRWSSLNGWHPITSSEMDGFTFTGNVTKDTITVNINLMLEIRDQNDGNNPHTGGVEGYDDGISYLQHIGQKIKLCSGGEYICNYNPQRASVLNCQGLFKYVLDNSPECIWTEVQYSNLENIGFNISCELDTKKCWGVYTNDNDKLHIDNSYNIFEKHRKCIWCGTKFVYNDNSGEHICIEIGQNKECEYCDTEITRECDIKWESELNTRKVNYSIQNPEHYKVINVKNISLIYKIVDEPNHYEYNEHEFINYILPYIEDMIPSTAIIDLQIERKEDICPYMEVEIEDNCEIDITFNQSCYLNVII